MTKLTVEAWEGLTTQATGTRYRYPTRAEAEAAAADLVAWYQADDIVSDEDYD